jgi:hypothetical protein
MSGPGGGVTNVAVTLAGLIHRDLASRVAAAAGSAPAGEDLFASGVAVSVTGVPLS